MDDILDVGKALRSFQFLSDTTVSLTAGSIPMCFAELGAFPLQHLKKISATIETATLTCSKA